MNARHIALAGGYGALAGSVAALTFALMNGVQHLLWSHTFASHPLYIIAVILAGAGLLVALHRLMKSDSPPDVLAQMQQAHDPLHAQKRTTLLIALSAIVAVGFGGAVGPEAGLLAVVMQCSGIVAARLAHDQREARLIGDTGSIAALSGLYGAPPGAAVLVDEGDNATFAADATPLALKFLAGVCGLAAFLLVCTLLLSGGFSRLALPAHTIPGDGSDILLALPAALAGGLIGLLSMWLHGKIPALLARLSRREWQILAGSAVFALIAATTPLLRFSGHHELEHALEHGIHAGWWTLAWLAAGKVLVMNICLASGWRGGEIFPLIFAGTAAGALMAQLIPGIPLSVALMAAIAACCAAGFGKPVATLLILLLLADINSPGALFTGILVGYGLRRMMEK